MSSQEKKNLIKEHLEKELKLFSPEQFLCSFFLVGDEWEIYKTDDKSLLYMLYDLTDDGLGYCFCIEISCKKMEFDRKYTQYIMSFGSFLEQPWEDCEQYTRDQLLFDAIHRLDVYKT